MLQIFESKQIAITWFQSNVIVDYDLISLSILEALKLVNFDVRLHNWRMIVETRLESWQTMLQLGGMWQ